MKFEFGGFSTDTLRDVRDEMEIIYDNDYEITMITKKTYEHREEGLNFDYKYVVNAVDLYDATGDDYYDENEPFFVEVVMVVAPHSLHPKVLEVVKDSTEGCCDYLDIIQYGHSIRMLEGGKLFPVEGIEELMYKVAYFIELIDGMRGFHLDKAWNMVGTTGWDTIEECVNNESAMDKIFNRYKEA